MGAAASVLAPAPTLAVTVEVGPTGSDEVHLHVGGQAFWIARMLAELGVDVMVAATEGGEAGAAVLGLLDREPVVVRAVHSTAATGVYVHDRRGGERRVVTDVPNLPLDRHAVDDLYGAMVTASIGRRVAVLGGPAGRHVVPPDLYERLSRELRGLGCTVVADLSGPLLAAVLRGGIDVLKVSDEELRAEGWIEGGDDAAITAGLRRLHDEGAGAPIVTRSGGAPTLALVDGRVVRVTGPTFETVDDRGVGDSLTGGVAAGLAEDADLPSALRLGVAAAALNATRRGAGSGAAEDIRALAREIDVAVVRA